MGTLKRWGHSDNKICAHGDFGAKKILLLILLSHIGQKYIRQWNKVKLRMGQSIRTRDALGFFSFFFFTGEKGGKKLTTHLEFQTTLWGKAKQCHFDDRVFNSTFKFQSATKQFI